MATLELEQIIRAGGERSRLQRAMASRDWLVYGAGRTGRKWAAALAASGRTVHGFVDRKAQSTGDLPVFAPAECPAHMRQDCAVLLALHNPSVDVAVVKAALLRDGYRTIWLLQELIDAFPEQNNFWLAASLESLPFADDIHKAHGLLADGPSRQLFAAILDQRLNGAADALPVPDMERHYFPKDLPSPELPMRFVDCGAYTGDTIDTFRRNGFTFDEIAAFEPDPAHYPTLCASLAADQAYVFPCGVWDRMTQLRFVSDDSASHISQDGEVVIQTLALDQAIPGFKVNYLKMDIEGAERNALLGAARLIEKNRPRLAISTYHKPRDLWELMLLVDEWKLDYSFHLRSHSFNSFETVLYALPTT